MPRNDGIASGESIVRKLGGWDEADVGAVGNDAPLACMGGMLFNLPNRRIRDPFVRWFGRGSREVFPIQTGGPGLLALFSIQYQLATVSRSD